MHEPSRNPSSPANPRRSEEPPKTCGQWLIALLLTGLFGIVVLAIWDWEVWKKFALVAWLLLGAWIIFSVCVG